MAGAANEMRQRCLPMLSLTFSPTTKVHPMNRDEMIRKLVQHSVKAALAESRHYWLSEMFEKGFAGYRSLSRKQLLQELQMRGLEKPADDFDDDDIDELDLDYVEAPLDLALRAGRAE
jgi:hypothetical protein